MTTLPQHSGPLGPDERFAILQQELQRAVAAGWTVEGQWPPARAVVARTADVNHVVHAILSLLTCGLWLIVWLAVAIGSNKPVRQSVYVDEAGLVHRSPAGVPVAAP